MWLVSYLRVRLCCRCFAFHSCHRQLVPCYHRHIKRYFMWCMYPWCYVCIHFAYVFRLFWFGMFYFNVFSCWQLKQPTASDWLAPRNRCSANQSLIHSYVCHTFSSFMLLNIDFLPPNIEFSPYLLVGENDPLEAVLLIYFLTLLPHINFLQFQGLWYYQACFVKIFLFLQCFTIGTEVVWAGNTHVEK